MRAEESKAHDGSVRDRMNRAAIWTIAAIGIVVVPACAAAQTVEELRQLSIEELANIEITSVSKRPQPLSEAPASVYVITSEDIRRSGAASLPEVLRLAPNLQVARIDAATYAISARGFNSFQAANKLLVLIDGRSVYTPLHGGVFWDQQQILLEDIDRIEVISGPGGTLWGANAVNGVINIITKNSRETQGGFAGFQLGNLDKSASARYGGKLGANGTYRVYALGFQRGDTVLPDGDSAKDDWNGKQAGFRMDWLAGDDAFTLQGDLYDNDLAGGTDNSGGNLLGRWTRQLGDASALEVQAYYDKADRLALGVTDSLETFDIEAQHRFPLGDRHAIIWGGGYRLTEDKFINELNPFVLDPESDTVQIGNLFVQDSIALSDDLTLTLGTKLEYSGFTGFEYLPSARVAWQISDTALLWAAVSRAVRTPSRVDRDLTAPGILERASESFDSEELIAYEVGYRGQPSAQTSLSVSLFYNDYDNLRALMLSPDSGLLVFGNVLEGQTYGVEAWGDYRPRDWWTLSAGANLLQKDLHLKPGGIDAALSQHVGNDPEYQLSLRSRMDLSDAIELDIGLRAIDDLPDPDVPGYVALDARLGWHVTDTLELSVGGFNLLDDQHPEAGNVATRTEVPRSVYLGARWRF
ncbi:MAG TPA: TonB-dependent receptor [Ferrovibrio sp.]|uniref:TonB-dependent receptor plug domain-containing protein n=1 Tax=Ferrovibrio sp. TaxID=1917215 RepID=UPI002ED406FE